MVGNTQKKSVLKWAFCPWAAVVLLALFGARGVCQGIGPVATVKGSAQEPARNDGEPPISRRNVLDRHWHPTQYGYRPGEQGFRCRAFWGGSILAPHDGPWNLGLEPTLDPEVQWRRTIDWCAALGIDTLIAGASWGNMRELLLFERHPAASTVPEAVVLANRKRINAILAHARRKGVCVLFHSYNLHAPQTWVDAHPQLRRKQERYIGVSLKHAGYADNLCWRDEIYRGFLTDCWDELFRVCPDLGGLLLTVGEANKCDHCLPEMDAVAKDFLETFAAVTRRHGRAGWVRTWHFRKFPTQHPDVMPAPILNVHTHPERYVPDDLVYVMKYSHTDCVEAEPDPGIVEAWKAEGKTLLLHMSLYGENTPAAHRWTSPRLQAALVARARRSGADGIVIGSQNTGSEICKDPPYWMNPLALVYYAGHDVAYDDRMWHEYLSAFFPGAEKALLSIFDRWAEAVLSMPRIYGQSQEGFTFGWGFSSARIGTAEWDPPWWWQEDLLGACEWLEYVKAHGYDPEEIEKLAAGRTVFADYAVEQFRKIDGAFADMERLLASHPGERAGLEAIRDDLVFWRLFQFQTAWLFRHKLLTTALAGARSPAVKADVQRELDDCNRVLTRWVLSGRADLNPAGDVPDDAVRRLAQATAVGASATVGTAWLNRLAADRDMIACGFLLEADGSLRLPAIWMTLDGGQSAAEGYFLDGETIKIGRPGVLDVRGGTKGSAWWTFPGEPGRYAITVHYMDDKDDRGRKGAVSVLSVDGQAVLQWDYTIDDDGLHAVRGEADLRRGSLVRIVSSTEPDVHVAAEYCRIQTLIFSKIK